MNDAQREQVKEAVEDYKDQVEIICSIEDINKRKKFMNIEIQRIIDLLDSF